MNWRSSLGRLLTIAILVGIVAVFVVPKPWQWVALVVTLLLILANFGEAFRGFRRDRDAANAVLAAHPGETILGTGLIAFEDSTRQDRARVVAVLADRSGLSFRDRADVEVVKLAADRILGIELAPLNSRSAIRPARIALGDGAPVEFFVGSQPDAQAEAVVAIRTALGRHAG